MNQIGIIEQMRLIVKPTIVNTIIFGIIVLIIITVR